MLQCNNGRCCDATEALNAESRIHSRRIAVKKTSLSIAAVIALSVAGATTSFAAELPTYEARGLPISPVQASLLGAADVREAQAAPVAISPLQMSVLTPRHRVNTAAAAPITVGTAR
jgi:hypothetical protein